MEEVTIIFGVIFDSIMSLVSSMTLIEFCLLFGLALFYTQFLVAGSVSPANSGSIVAQSARSQPLDSLFTSACWEPCRVCCFTISFTTRRQAADMFEMRPQRWRSHGFVRRQKQPFMTEYDAIAEHTTRY